MPSRIIHTVFSSRLAAKNDFFLPDYTRQYVLTYLPNCFHSPNSHLPSFHAKYLPSICQYYSEFESHLTDFECQRSSRYDFLQCY